MTTTDPNLPRLGKTKPVASAPILLLFCSVRALWSLALKRSPLLIPSTHTHTASRSPTVSATMRTWPSSTSPSVASPTTSTAFPSTTSLPKSSPDAETSRACTTPVKRPSPTADPSIRNLASGTT